MLMLIDRLDKSLTGQQKELWRNADVQRDAFFKNLETSIDQVNRGADVQTIRLQDTVLLFDDTMRAVTRTLNDPFVIRASPSYIVPAPGDITFTISGSYLSNGNGSLRLDGRDARLIGNQPTEVKFVLPSNLLPQNSKAIVPVSLDLTLVTKGWFFNGTQAYKIASFVLPPQVGNVSIVAHRTYSDTERETRYEARVALPVGQGVSAGPASDSARLSDDEYRDGWRYVSALAVSPDTAQRPGCVGQRMLGRKSANHLL